MTNDIYAQSTNNKVTMTIDQSPRTFRRSVIISYTIVPMTNILHYLLIITGSISVALGVAGIFLPLLPTTPFLLLAAGCFFRSSNRLYSWLINHRIFGNYIRSYREYRAIPLFTKITSIILLWITIGYSVIFAVEAVWVIILLLAIALGVSIHILCLRTLTRDMKKINLKNPESVKMLADGSTITVFQTFRKKG